MFYLLLCFVNYQLLTKKGKNNLKINPFLFGGSENKPDIYITKQSKKTQL